MAEIGFGVEDGGKVERVAAVLDSTGEWVMSRVFAFLEREIEVGVELAREAIKKMPVKGVPKSKSVEERGSLRDIIAGSTHGGAVRIGTDVVMAAVEIEDHGEVKGLNTVAAGIESSVGWRHPVFGNKNAWVTQDPQYEWFTPAFIALPGRLTTCITESLELAAARIADA